MITRLKNLFTKKKNDSNAEASVESPTIPRTSPLQFEPEIPKAKPTRILVPQLMVGSAQSIGMVRDHNEDSILTLSCLTMDDGDHIPLGLFVVADGMGGHKQGEVASKIAVRTFAREVLRRVMMGLFETQPVPPEQSIQEIMEESVMEAHQLITKEAPGSGTTMTAIFILGRQMTIAHVGDSRAYTIDPDGKTEILTRDHSLVKRMMELGHLTEDEAAVHPQRNVLYRALGQGEPFTPDVSTTPTPDSGYLMLCSDGLWGLVSQEEIAASVTKEPSPEKACQLLVDSANRAGGPDNISVIMVKLPDYPA